MGDLGEDVLHTLGDVTAVDTADVEDDLWSKVRVSKYLHLLVHGK